MELGARETLVRIVRRNVVLLFLVAIAIALIAALFIVIPQAQLSQRQVTAPSVVTNSVGNEEQKPSAASTRGKAGNGARPQQAR